MPNCTNQIYARPFRSQADQAREAALQKRYGEVSIPAVVAALQMQPYADRKFEYRSAGRSSSGMKGA